ncbi:MAG: RNA-binding cell elongation regulator Jag/EloR [Desulfobacterales bacterium]|nr:RNA-binding cell elongation regulator Jag/EloR [Desulfobacterales bacterium]
MSTKLEFKGKNLDKAVERASTELKLPKDELKYEVLSYGSSGIFGLTGARKAKIRVQLPEDTLASEAKDTSVADSSPEAVAYGATVDSAEMDSSNNGRTTDQSDNGQTLYAFPDDPAEMGRLVLRRIVDAITSDAKISVEKVDDRICFNVNGGNAGVLIGKRGQTLDAIQAIVHKVVNKHNQSRTRVLVDIEGYLETRKENLEKMALRLAEKSKKIGKPMTLGPMNAYDRRIVHLALQDFSAVQTRSRGEGPLRKLVIFPQKRNAARQ